MSDKQVVVVFEANTAISCVALRTSPVSPADAICIASRMWHTPTPPRIEPATRERLDHYPEMCEVKAVCEFIYKRPAVVRWHYDAAVPGN